MAELKTQRTKASVSAFLAAIPDAAQRKDAKALAALMRRVTRQAPAMWGPQIVGYGEMTYAGSNGRTVDWFPVGFSPRKAALTVYLMGGLKVHGALLKGVGRHKIGGGCLYLPRLAEVDMTVLSRLIAASYELNTAETPRATKTAPKARKRAG